ncbi:MAG: HAD family phosphatase [Clostridiales bacterium]|nr:HAD family phosphatase [Clostridiales bacterium]
MKNNRMERLLQDVDAVLFDLDGTLADSMWVWSEIDRDFFRDHEIDFPDYLNREIEGLGFTETAQFFVDNFPLEESVEEIKQLWNDMAIEKYRTKVPLKPGAGEFLTALKERGIKTGIATSNSMLLVDTFLNAAGIGGQIDAVTTACEVSRGKPSPDVYLVTAKKLNVLPERCLVFEDIPMGIRAGKNAGMRVCAVEDEYSAHQREEKRALADEYIEDFREIYERIYDIRPGGRAADGQVSV